MRASVSAGVAMFLASPSGATQDWESECGAVFVYGSEVEFRPIRDFHVYGWDEKPIDMTELYDTRIDGVYCIRSVPVPMEHDDKVVQAGFPLYIRSANEWYAMGATPGDPVLVVLDRTETGYTFRVLEGEIRDVWLEFALEEIAKFDARLQDDRP